MAKIVVYHSGFGCATGCCGHTIKGDDNEEFFFDHPWGEDYFEWAKELVRREWGAEHVADLDWDNCIVVADC
jgi:hypothetical protein